MRSKRLCVRTRVLDGEGRHRTGYGGTDFVGSLLVPPNWSGRAFGEIRAQAKSLAQRLQNCANGSELTVIQVAQNNHVVRKEQDTRCGMPRSEALQDSSTHRLRFTRLQINVG